MSSRAVPFESNARRYVIDQLANQMPDLVFRFAKPSELPEIRELERLEYERAGYMPPGGKRSKYYREQFDRLPETHLLIARRSDTGRLVGTISATLDGPEGLPADIDFPAKAEMIRESTRTLAQVWRFAVDSEHRASTRIALGLMSLAMFSDFAFDVTTVIATIHPKHLGFYRLLGHEPIAYRPCAAGLTDAPALLIGVVDCGFVLKDERPWECDLDRPLAEMAA